MGLPESCKKMRLYSFYFLFFLLGYSCWETLLLKSDTQTGLLPVPAQKQHIENTFGKEWIRAQ